LSELGLTGTDPLCGDDLSERPGDPVTLNVERLPRSELIGQPIGFLGRQSDDSAVFEQYSVEVSARSMQLRLDMALRREVCAAVARTRGTVRATIGDGGAGRVIGH
jgi:hypothetical protein